MDPVSIVNRISRDLLEARRLLAEHVRNPSIDDHSTNREHDIPIRLKTSEMEIEVWSKFWNVGEGTRPSLYESLWGEAGQDEIHMCLMEIESSARRILGYITLQSEGIKEGKTLIPWKRMVRGRKTHQRGSMRLAELYHHTIVLGNAVDRLSAISQTHFQARHPIHQETIPQSESTLVGLKNIVGTMTHSQALYWCCHHSSSSSIYLHIDLFEGQEDSLLPKSDAKLGQRQEKLRYHLSCGQPESKTPSTNFVIESLEGNDLDHCSKSTAEIRPIHSIDEVLSFPNPHTDTIYKSQLVRTFSVQSSESHRPSYFYISKPPTDLVLTAPLGSLWQFFNEVRYKPFYDSGHLLLGARFDLAFKVVKCALHLLGTPWLSDISSSNLLQVTTTDISDLYLLVTTSDILDESPRPHVLSGMDSIASQVFRVGVLLIEIALEIPLNLDELVSDMEHTSLFKMTHQVAARMGSAYAEAAGSCLQQRFNLPSDQADLDDAQAGEALILDRLAFFHRNVYTPIERARQTI